MGFALSMHRRRGAAAAGAAVMGTMMLGFAALSVDVAYLYNAQAELQSVADAAALAGAIELLNEKRLLGETEMTDTFLAVRRSVAYIAERNQVTRHNMTVGQNLDNSPEGDLLIGRLDNFDDKSEPLSTTSPEEFNTVVVRMRRDATRNGPVSLWFARIWGMDSSSIVTQATAGFETNVVGFRKTPDTGNPLLLPLALDVDYWDRIRNAIPGGDEDYSDEYAYDPLTGEVKPGSDGFPEINIYPGSGVDQLPPGNYGTVDIGPNNNATDDLERQILEGLNDYDLEPFDGEFSLADGPVYLNGDTGISAGIKEELTAIIGQGRTVPLFDEVISPGNNATFRIVRFAGIRIMAVQLTGSMNKKHVMIQPAFVADDSAITQAGSDNTSEFVFLPVRLVR